MSLENTIGNETWLTSNEINIKALFPTVWTNIEQLNGIQLGSNLRSIGVDWRSKEEFEMIMVFFEKVGFAIRDGKSIKRNPNNVF